MMGEQKKIDFVTVCYRDEIPLLRLQARSFSRFVDPSVIQKIVLVVNEEAPKRTMQLIRAEVLPEYGALQHLVELLPYRTLAKTRVKRTGWRSQQVLKLLAASILQAEAYMALDCKNHFIRPFDGTKVWSDEDGKVQMPANHFVPEFRRDYETACVRFAVAPLSGSARVLPSVTPFLFWRSDVTALVAALEEAANKPLAQLFFEGPRVTEFYLYMAWLQKIYGDIWHRYEEVPRASFSLMAGQARESGVQEAVARIESAATGAYMFGVHRKIIESNDPEIRAQVLRLWQEAGLVETAAEAAFFWAIYKRSLPEKLISLVSRKLTF